MGYAVMPQFKINPLAGSVLTHRNIDFVDLKKAFH